MKDLKAIAASALDALKTAGADTASVRAAYGETREFNVDGGEFSLLRTLFDNSLSLEAIKDGKRGTALINQFDEASIKAAAENCLASAEASEPDEAWELGPDAGERTFTAGAVEPDLDLLFERCRELMETVKKEYPLILMEQMIVKHSKDFSVYANTNGSVFEKAEGSYNISLMYSAHEGDKSSSFFGCDVTTADLSKPFIELGAVRRSFEDVSKQVHTAPVEGKFEGTVLLTPDCVMNVLYYALATFASGATVFDGTSIWKDKLGEAVADEGLTVTLAPCHEDVVAGDSWTSDGYVVEDCDIIKDGKLVSFLMNKYFSNKTGHERSGNSCVGNMFIPAGTTPVADIISGIDKGLMVSRVSGGNPAVSGDFSMVAKNSFIIEDGKVGSAVSEVMINGNLADLLNNIRAVSIEKEPDGRASLPWMAFDGVTISGK